MMQLKATKTSLYKLVSTYEDLPGMRKTTIKKAYRRPDWWLEWVDERGLRCNAFFSIVLGQPLLAIEKMERFERRQISRVVHRLDINDLMERGMTEEMRANK